MCAFAFCGVRVLQLVFLCCARVVVIKEPLYCLHVPVSNFSLKVNYLQFGELQTKCKGGFSHALCFLTQYL